MMTLSDADRNEVLSLLHEIKKDVKDLAYHGGPLDTRFAIPRESRWLPLNGRDGVTFFNVPHNDGGDSLYAGLFVTESGANYNASLLDCSRLVVVSHGTIFSHRGPIHAGQSIFLEAGEATTWRSTAGCRGVVFYDVPKPESHYFSDNPI